MPLVLNRSRELENLEWRFLRQFAVEDAWQVKEPVWYRPPTPPPPPVGKDSLGYQGWQHALGYQCLKLETTRTIVCN